MTFEGTGEGHLPKSCLESGALFRQKDVYLNHLWHVDET